jgi:hypothetical protein
MTDKPQTREDFYLATVVRLLDEGLDLQAARLHAIGIVASYWPREELTQTEFQKDYDEERRDGWAADYRNEHRP